MSLTPTPPGRVRDGRGRDGDRKERRDGLRRGGREGRGKGHKGCRVEGQDGGRREGRDGKNKSKGRRRRGRSESHCRPRGKHHLDPFTTRVGVAPQVLWDERPRTHSSLDRKDRGGGPEGRTRGSARERRRGTDSETDRRTGAGPTFVGGAVVEDETETKESPGKWLNSDAPCRGTC